MNFEWDHDKATLNRSRHRVTFDEAKEAFWDPHTIDDYDDEHSFDETRYHLIGMSRRRLWFIVYTEPQAT